MAKTKTLKNHRLHDFYCLNCGNKNMSLLRPRSHLREENHRKALYCFHCKQIVNHIECKNDLETYNFINDFNEGKYIEEAKESISFLLNKGCNNVN